jgi:predicted esterase YcpF (UPF0227 family)
MKIAYLHGLESNNIGPKNDWLRTVSEVFDPKIDYRQKQIYQTLRDEIIPFKPDLLIGSSMGGYFAFEMAKELNTDAILFNPALHSRSFEPDMTGLETGKHKPYIHTVFGKEDTLINPDKTLVILKKEGFERHTFFEHGHKTPFEVFKNIIESYIEKRHEEFS